MAATPHFSHLVALAFLGGGFCIVVCLAVALYGAVRKSHWAAKLGAGCALVGITGYAVVLLGVGILSRQKVLSPGQWKYFCEADCHIAYSIADVRTAGTLGLETKPTVASGTFVVVRLKTWFDERSIAKFRGNAQLTPNPRVVTLMDNLGRVYSSSLQAEVALDGTSTPLTQPLRPGESYLTSFVFDVPHDAKDLRLLVADKDPLSSLIIDHENSPFHGKIFLAVEKFAPSSPLAWR